MLVVVTPLSDMPAYIFFNLAIPAAYIDMASRYPIFGRRPMVHGGLLNRPFDIYAFSKNMRRLLGPVVGQDSLGK